MFPAYPQSKIELNYICPAYHSRRECERERQWLDGNTILICWKLIDLHSTSSCTKNSTRTILGWTFSYNFLSTWLRPGATVCCNNSCVGDNNRTLYRYLTRSPFPGLSTVSVSSSILQFSLLIVTHLFRLIIRFRLYIKTICPTWS